MAAADMMKIVIVAQTAEAFAIASHGVPTARLIINGART